MCGFVCVQISFVCGLYCFFLRRWCVLDTGTPLPSDFSFTNTPFTDLFILAPLYTHNLFAGKIVSLRFLEWVRANPTGVVALPTGRTPEFFIKTLDRYKTHWHTPEVRK